MADAWTPPGSATPPDPLAVAVGNGSLLGLGYLLLGRRGTAVATAVVTLGLVAVLAVAFRSVWMELVLVGWWAAMILHGWLLARGQVRPAADGRVRRQRLLAFGVAVPVLLVIGLLRWDAGRVDADLSEARDQGDCAAAREAVDRVWFGHRLGDAPVTAQADATADACDRIETAETNLNNALSPPVDDWSLGQGFHNLELVLTEQPGHERMVDAALDGFLKRLPLKDACETVAITDELRKQGDRDDELDRAADVVPDVAPPALVKCGAALTSSHMFDDARARYQQLLDEYPRHRLAARATQGILGVELTELRTLGSSYCHSPMAYRGAPPYRRGVNRALIHGDDTYVTKLPAWWRTTDEADAALIVCIGPEELGPAVETCFYERKPGELRPALLPGQVDPGNEVTFHKVRISVQAFELRTGKRVVNTKVTIGGASCPRVLRYETYFDDFGPSDQQYVAPSTADIRAAFTGVFTRR